MSLRKGALTVAVGLFVLTAWNAPAAAQTPQILSFQATVSDENLVTLSFASSNTLSLLFIKDFEEPTQLPNNGFVPPTGTVSFRAKPGRNRFTFIATSASFEQIARDVDVNVPFPAPPTVVGPTLIDVDVVAPVAAQLRWSPRPEGFFRVRAVEALLDLDAPGARPGRPQDFFTDRFDVPAAVPGQEIRSFGVRFCKDKPGNVPYCSEEVIYTVRLRPSLFLGPARDVRAAAGGSFPLSWDGPTQGRLFVLCERFGATDACASFGQGGVGRIVANTNTLTVSNLQPGLHEFQLQTCTPGPGSTVSEVIANADCLRPLTSIKQVVVAPRTQWQLNRPIANDFTVSVFDAKAIGRGLPLDILIDSANQIYVQSEFNRALLRVRTDVGATGFFSGETQAFTYPLLLTPVGPDGNQTLQTVRPFGNPLSNKGTTNVSASGEKVLETRSSTGRRFIWTTQGGRLSPVRFMGRDRSRILRFEPAAVDNPRTWDDERFCAFTAPGNENRVTGLASDGQRMFYTEFPAGDTPAVVAFNPDELQCENMLDFDLPAVSTHRHCNEGETFGCFKRIPLVSGPMPPTGSQAFVGHVAVDPVDGQLWVAGSLGFDFVLRVHPTTGDVQRFPLPTGSGFGNFVFDRKPGLPERPGSRPLASIGPAAFQIRVTADHVFVGEFGDVDIVRLRKADIGPACTSLSGRNNPCMDQVHVPVRSGFTQLHSIEVFQDRLYFTLDDETGSALHPDLSTIGYVTTNLQSGVVYSPISQADDGRKTGPASYHGLSIDPDDGTIALADFRRQVVRLTRRP